MAPKTIIKHEMKEGALTIVLVNADVADTAEEQKMAELTFEDGVTGAIYEAAFTHDDLCRICPVFYMQDEIPEILAETPSVVRVLEPRAPIEVRFKHSGKKREYLIILPLRAREYSGGVRDVVELRSENFVLRRRVTALEAKVARVEASLADMLTKQNAVKVEYGGAAGELEEVLKRTSADNLFCDGEHALFQVLGLICNSNRMYEDAVILLSMMTTLNVLDKKGLTPLGRLDSILAAFESRLPHMRGKQVEIQLGRIAKMLEFRALLVVRM